MVNAIGSRREDEYKEAWEEVGQSIAQGVVINVVSEDGSVADVVFLENLSSKPVPPYLESFIYKQQLDADSGTKQENSKTEQEGENNDNANANADNDANEYSYYNWEFEEEQQNFDPYEEDALEREYDIMVWLEDKYDEPLYIDSDDEIVEGEDSTEC